MDRMVMEGGDRCHAHVIGGDHHRSFRDLPLQGPCRPDGDKVRDPAEGKRCKMGPEIDPVRGLVPLVPHKQCILTAKHFRISKRGINHPCFKVRQSGKKETRAPDNS